MLNVMTSDVVGKIGRGIGWISVTAVSISLAVIFGILPLSLLPGRLHTDFVHGQWIKLAGVVFVGIVLVWRLSPMNSDIRFSPRAAGSCIWLAVTAFMMAFWPLGFAVWFNAYNSSVVSVRDMAVLGMESVTVRPAATPIKSYDLRELSTGWTANLEVTDERERFLMPGRCVQIVVRRGRLGLDWISDAKPITCPANGK